MPVIGFRLRYQVLLVGKSANFKNKVDIRWRLRPLAKLYTSHFQEKLLTLIIYLSVLRTNTRGQGEYPKASELTIVKELCKLAP